MSRYDFNAPRLYVEAPLGQGDNVALTNEQVNYLRAVLRLRDGDNVLAFNGRDGEWRCVIAAASRKSWGLDVLEQTRAQIRSGDLHYLFAPLKHARQDYMAQKAVEMGASLLQPTITRRTQARHVNLERLRANAIEAAEQCGILQIPEIAAPKSLEEALADWPADRLLIFCDEDAEVADPVSAIRNAGPASSLAVLVGPEGGFDPGERDFVRRTPQAVIVSLGPRILRADTAAIAALAAAQIALGDWRGN